MHSFLQWNTKKGFGTASKGIRAFLMNLRITKISMKYTDFIIVGQGLAGTMLAHFLCREGAEVVLIDDARSACASAEAAGLINPITGRRYVKSWRIDALLPFAFQTYRELEAELDRAFFYERPIFRAFFSARESNDWWARAMEPGFEAYFDPQADPGALVELCSPVHSYGAVRQSAQVDTRALLQAFSEKWTAEGRLLQEAFRYEDVIPEGSKVRYKDITARSMIFCEGYGMASNPFFNHLPMEGAKGEVLLVHIPGFPTDRILKHKIFIAPLGAGEVFWAGATYDWGFPDSAPTEEKGRFLREALQEILRVPFEVTDHRAAVRPTVKDRRPLLGFHPAYPQLGIFNGLGTKGASLSPFWGHHFAQVLLERSAIDPEVDIRRFG